jgi:hypothetical protein
MARAGKREFRATLEPAGDNGAWVVLTPPFSVEEAFGSRARVAVRGTMNGFAFRTSLFPAGDGTHQTIQVVSGKGMLMPSKKSPYDAAHPGLAMEGAWLERLREKTGKSMEEWVRIVQKSGPAAEKERVEWLKKEHGLGTNYAKWIAERSSGRNRAEEYGDPETLVDAMFAGKEPLRPLYEQLLRLGKSLGEDVKACPCKTIVPLYRRHVFAQLKPATKTRIDLGLALKDTPVRGRLIDTGGFAKKDRITHRIPVTSVEDIDEELKRWLRKAYDMDA